MRHLLKNGNKPYDLRLHPNCGALKRKGGICKGKAMKNGKCRLHGGKSTGAITQVGKEKCAKKLKSPHVSTYKEGELTGLTKVVIL